MMIGVSHYLATFALTDKDQGSLAGNQLLSAELVLGCFPQGTSRNVNAQFILCVKGESDLTLHY